MTGHIRYRVCGGSIVAPATTKPFRKTDLTGREELAQVRAEIAKLESHARSTTQETLDSFPDLALERNQRIAELKKKERELDFIWNDAAAPATPPPPAPITLADINRHNAEHYKGRS